MVSLSPFWATATSATMSSHPCTTDRFGAAHRKLAICSVNMNVPNVHIRYRWRLLKPASCSESMKMPNVRVRYPRRCSRRLLKPAMFSVNMKMPNIRVRYPRRLLKPAMCSLNMKVPNSHVRYRLRLLKPALCNWNIKVPSLTSMLRSGGDGGCHCKWCSNIKIAGKSVTKVRERWKIRSSLLHCSFTCMRTELRTAAFSGIEVAGTVLGNGYYHNSAYKYAFITVALRITHFFIPLNDKLQLASLEMLLTTTCSGVIEIGVPPLNTLAGQQRSSCARLGWTTTSNAHDANVSYTVNMTNTTRAQAQWRKASCCSGWAQRCLTPTRTLNCVIFSQRLRLSG